MPIYEYQCDHCAHQIEALQKISDEPLKECPECKKLSLKKLISAVSFRLKGAGWYETDFKTGEKKQLAELDSSSNKENKSEGESGEKTKVDSSAPKSEKNDSKSEVKKAKKKSSGSNQKENN